MDVATLAELLRETGEHHHHYEKAHPKHDWWDWYAPYISARQHESTPEEAATAAGLYMEKIRDAAPSQSLQITPSNVERSTSNG